MATQAAVHQRNMESSILFMQQEHAGTLKALHEEIHVLQKKCSDLTFQLTMHGCIDEPEGGGKQQEIETELSAVKGHNAKLQMEMELKDKKIKILESDIHVQKKKYLGELRTQTQTINSLKAELEAKSHNIAYLTTEYHKLKLKEKVDPDGGADPTIRRTQMPSYVPTPPKEIQAKLRRTHRRGANEELQQRPLRVTSGKSSGSSRSESPDISPFVQRDTKKPIVAKRQQTTVLPPISKSMTQEKNSVIVHQVIQPKHMNRRNRESVSPEIATLAVDQVAMSEPGLVRAQQSHSSEYQ